MSISISGGGTVKTPKKKEEGYARQGVPPCGEVKHDRDD
jgi:hypothetical protein